MWFLWNVIPHCFVSCVNAHIHMDDTAVACSINAHCLTDLDTDGCDLLLLLLLLLRCYHICGGVVGTYCWYCSSFYNSVPPVCDILLIDVVFGWCVQGYWYNRVILVRWLGFIVVIPVCESEMEQQCGLRVVFIHTVPRVMLNWYMCLYLVAVP